MNDLLKKHIWYERSKSNIYAAADLEEEAMKLVENDEYRFLFDSDHNDELLALLTENPIVNLPVIFQDMDRMMEDRDEVFIDPPKIGNPVRLNDYLAYQRRFFSLQFINNGERAKFLISRALHYSGNFYNQQELLDLIDKLYQNGWILGAYEVTKWKIGILCNGEEGKYDEICQNIDFIQELANKTKEKLSQAKDLSIDLNEWFKAIHDVLPDVYLVGTLAHKNKNDESELIDRYFDEAQADIGTTIGICTSAIIRKELKPLSNVYLFKKESFESKTGRELIRDIRYHYKARTILPKFWYESAKEFINSDTDDLPSNLDEFDPTLVLGLGISMSELDNLFMMLH